MKKYFVNLMTKLKKKYIAAQKLKNKEIFCVFVLKKYFPITVYFLYKLF